MTDSHWLDDLDTAWDAEARGGSSGSLDAATAQTLTRLTTLQRAADAPLSGRSRVWTAPSRSKRGFRLPAPRFRAVHAYGLVALLLAVTFAGAFSLARDERPAIASATSIPAVGGQELYRIDGVTGAWQAMDPTTLADIPGDSTPGLAKSSESIAFGLVSGDGSTLVGFASGPNGTLYPEEYVVYDARTMATRSRISLLTQSNAGTLSEDGKKLAIVESQGQSSDWSVTGLKIFDTTTAQPIASLNLLSVAIDVFEFPIVDSTLTHAYVLSRSTPTTSATARDVQLTEFDLSSGKVLHQLTIKQLLRDPSRPLIDVPAGSNQVLYHGLPGISLSPDGRTLVLLSPESTQLMLIRTNDWVHVQSLNVETSANSSCFPTDVDFYSAPAFVGTRMVATGFVYKTTQPLGAVDFQKSTTCSIQLPDPASREHVVFAEQQSLADMLPGGWFLRFTGIFTNGTSLYVVAIKQNADGQGPFTDYGVFRFNPETLAIEASVDYPIANPTTTLPAGFFLTFAPPS